LKTANVAGNLTGALLSLSTLSSWSTNLKG